MIDQPEPARTCSNCACFGYMGADGTVGSHDPTQPDRIPVCRRLTPGSKYVRAEVPVLDEKNQPVQGPRGPRLQSVQQLQIGYPATTPEAVCFEGWRPLGTLPGDSFKVGSFEQTLLPLLGAMVTGDQQAVMRLGQLLVARGLPPADSERN